MGRTIILLWSRREFFFSPGCLIYQTEPTICNVATGKLRRDGSCTGPVSSIPCMSVTSGSWLGDESWHFSQVTITTEVSAHDLWWVPWKQAYRGNCDVKDWIRPSCWGPASLSQRCLPTPCTIGQSVSSRVLRVPLRMTCSRSQTELSWSNSWYVKTASGKASLG